MGGKQNFINIFGSFTEPFNYPSLVVAAIVQVTIIQHCVDQWTCMHACSLSIATSENNTDTNFMTLSVFHSYH